MEVQCVSEYVCVCAFFLISSQTKYREEIGGREREREREKERKMSSLDPIIDFFVRRRRGESSRGSWKTQVVMEMDKDGTMPAEGLEVDEECEKEWIKCAGNKQRLIESRELMLERVKRAVEYAGRTLPFIEVRFDNLRVRVDALVGGTNALPSLVNTARSTVAGAFAKVGIKGLGPETRETCILDGVSGSIKPGRTTLVLGPPGSGKSVLLQVLSGRLKHRPPTMRIEGDVTFNGISALHGNNFCVEQTASYVEQRDVHIAQLTVRETLEFARQCQGDEKILARFAQEVLAKPSAFGIDVDADPQWETMKAFLEGVTSSLKTDVMLELLLLNRCADTYVGDAMLRGCSGGERRRVTSGEMLVGTKLLNFFDEISTGLDSASTFTICRAITNATRLLNKTTCVALLQPQPETFELFDDILVLAEGKIVWQGPPDEILDHFFTLGFSKPPMTDTADFLQEVRRKYEMHVPFTQSCSSHKHSLHTYSPHHDTGTNTC